jgi:hypothetical protein
MKIKINREIRDYTESAFFDMPLRQYVFAAATCAVTVAFAMAPPFLPMRHLLVWSFKNSDLKLTS